MFDALIACHVSLMHDMRCGDSWLEVQVHGPTLDKAKCGVGGGLGRGDQKVNESLAASNKRYRSSK